jgi:hypothetical protein
LFIYNSPKERAINRIRYDKTNIANLVSFILCSENVNIFSHGFRIIKCDGYSKMFPKYERKYSISDMYERYVKHWMNTYDLTKTNKPVSRSSFVKVAKGITFGQQKIVRAICYVTGEMVNEPISLLKRILKYIYSTQGPIQTHKDNSSEESFGFALSSDVPINTPSTVHTLQEGNTIASSSDVKEQSSANVDIAGEEGTCEEGNAGEEELTVDASATAGDDEKQRGNIIGDIDAFSDLSDEESDEVGHVNDSKEYTEKDLMKQLENIHHFLKGGVKRHVEKIHDDPRHSATYALCPPSMASDMTLQESTCSECAAPFIFIEEVKNLMTTMKVDNLSMTAALNNITKKFKDYYCHCVRVKNARMEIKKCLEFVTHMATAAIKKLHPTVILPDSSLPDFFKVFTGSKACRELFDIAIVTMDWKMKVLPLRRRETTRQSYGSRGMALMGFEIRVPLYSPSTKQLGADIFYFSCSMGKDR